MISLCFLPSCFLFLHIFRKNIYNQTFLKSFPFPFLPKKPSPPAVGTGGAGQAGRDGMGQRAASKWGVQAHMGCTSAEGSVKLGVRAQVRGVSVCVHACWGWVCTTGLDLFRTGDQAALGGPPNKGAAWQSSARVRRVFAVGTAWHGVFQTKELRT